MKWVARVVASVWLGCVIGCDGTVDVTVQTPPDALRFEVSDQDILLPDELRGGLEIASLPCGDTQLCPPMFGELSFACVDAVCDPEPMQIVLPVGDVIDFEQLSSELRDIVGNIEAIEVDFVRYNVTQFDLNVPLEPVELAWGPADATGFTPGTFPFGRMERWMLGNNDVDLNAQGVAALSDFLVHTSRQIRIFARTSVDLDPGQMLPQGAVVTDLQLSITVTGRIL